MARSQPPTRLDMLQRIRETVNRMSENGQLRGMLLRLEAIPGYSGVWTASASTIRPETPMHHLQNAFVTNYDAATPLFITVQNASTRNEAAASLTTGTATDTQRANPDNRNMSTPSSLTTGAAADMRRRKPNTRSRLTRSSLTTGAAADTRRRKPNTRNRLTRSSLTTGAAADTQRRRRLSLRYSHRKNTKTTAPPPVDPEDPVASSVSTPSTSVELTDTQRKPKRKKRSLRYSHRKNTKKATTPAIVENQIITYDCPICMDSSDYADMKTLPCGHGFHRMCVDRWLVSSYRCPVCRKVCRPPDAISQDGASTSNGWFATVRVPVGLLNYLVANRN